MTLILLFGPVSSGSPGGPSPFFSWLFVLMGSYVLIRTWIIYRKQRQGETTIPVVNPIGISFLSAVFIAVGLWGILH
jgi:hypothetical protein